MPIMLWIAAIIEAIIGNYGDMGILLAIQFINAGISFYETSKVRPRLAGRPSPQPPSSPVSFPSPTRIN